MEKNILFGESSTLEYKKQIPEDHIKLLKTVVAFANGKGGRIIFGIDDVTHEVLGMDEENIFKTIDSISDMIYNNCKPLIPCEVLLQTIENKTVIVVEIQQGLHSPYYIKSLGMENGCFIRASATTRLADNQTLRELMFEGSDTGYDQTPQNGKSVTKDEIKAFCDSLKNVAIENCKTDDERQSVKELTKNNLISWQLLYEKDGKLVPSNGFDLLSNNSIWSAKIQCGIFKGTDRTFFVDKREYEGSVQNQIKEAYDFVLRNIHLGAEIDGLYRRDVYEIPATVIRELIINAVVHRNYLESSHIQVALFDNRLEITSPGSIPKGVTIEKMKEGFSKIRNQGVANAFHYMHLIEHWGTGIPRIIKLVKEANLPELEIIDMDGALRINIYRKIGDKSAINSEIGDKSAINSKIGDNSATNLPKKDEKTLILEYLRIHKECTTKEIGEMLGLKSSRTKDYLNDLEESGLIIAKGANKNRTYIIKDSN